MTGGPSSPPPAGERGDTHVVPLRVLLGTWAALVVLTLITVEAGRLDLGNLGILIALGIASMKASFVALYFMHLRYDRPFNAVVFVSATLFVMLFISLALMDTRSYRPTKIPGYAPEIEAAAEAAPAAGTPAGGSEAPPSGRRQRRAAGAARTAAPPPPGAGAAPARRRASG